jgi:hypothetical protein
MSAKNIKRIEDALQALYEEGLKGYNAEARKEIPRWQAMGLGMAAAGDNVTGILQMAYAFLEDWNAHDLCAVIEWAHPLFGQDWHVSDMTRLRNMINKNNVTIRTEWDPAITEYKTKKYNVRIVFEEVTDEADENSE